MSVPYFDINNLTYRYEDGTVALDNISIKIEQGKKIALLGSNGAGKSTFLLHLNGLLKPTYGSVSFLGEPLKYSRKQLIDLRTKVGIVFQNPETQLFSGTVREDISFGPMNLKLKEEQRNQQVSMAIEQTEVEDLLDKPIHFLSGGQKKRVSIAGVLAMKPQVLILDEPTASLDVYYSKKIVSLLKQLHHSDKTTIVSTHNIQFAYEWADEVIVMHKGRILFQGDIVNLFENSQLIEEANLEIPLLFQLGKMMKDRGDIEDLHDYKTNESMMDLLSRIV